MLALRYATYTLGLLLVYWSLPVVIVHGDILIFKEGGTVEWCQFFVLVTTAAVFLAGVVRIPSFRRLCLFLALLAIIAAARELDSVLDPLLPVFGWKIPVTLVMAGAVLVVWQNPRQFVAQLRCLSQGRGLTLLWAAFVVIVIFSQLVGHGDFLEMLMGDDYMRDYKRVIEELGELFGYLLLLCGAIETLQDGAISEQSRARLAHLSARERS